MSKIHIPTPLRQYVGKQASVEVQGATVGEAMSSLVAQHPDLRKHLYTEEGKLRAFVNVYVNDEDIRYLLKEATALKAGDSISIVPSIAGGAGSTALRCDPDRLSSRSSLSSRAKRGI
jgi:MoaD family protein